MNKFTKKNYNTNNYNNINYNNTNYNNNNTNYNNTNYNNNNNNINYNNTNNLFKLINELQDDIIIQNKDQIKKYINNSKIFKIIPKGIKSILKFYSYTNYKTNITENKCVIQLLDLKHKKITKYINFDAHFSSKLINGTKDGTQFYGTYIQKNNLDYFIIEDVIYYKNIYVYKDEWESKINYLNDYYKYYFKNNVNNNLLCYLCYISNNFNNIYFYLEERNLQKLFNFDIYKLQIINNNEQKISINILNINNKIRNSNIYNINNNNKYINKEKLYIKSSLQTDVYECYKKDNNNKFIKKGILHVPSYKYSVFLNKLFRNIRENNNIDYIEESEDEEDFQNEDIFKYVKIDNIYIFECIYNNNFKKWEIINYDDYQLYEK